MTEPPRLVLDTNVCLDLLLFGDPRCEALRAALAQRRCEAVTNAACRDEFLSVLRYPALALDAARRAELEATFDALVVLMPLPDAATRNEPRLPRCKDPDDQKFLELARDAGAIALLTRDAALLVLARRAALGGRFAILRPEAWVPATDLDAPGPAIG